MDGQLNRGGYTKIELSRIGDRGSWCRRLFSSRRGIGGFLRPQGRTVKKRLPSGLTADTVLEFKQGDTPALKDQKITVTVDNTKLEVTGTLDKAAVQRYTPASAGWRWSALLPSFRAAALLPYI